MSDQVIVRCHSCRQKYRVSPDAVGKKTRCRKCNVVFVISSDAPINEDTVFDWISQEEDTSESATDQAPEYETWSAPSTDEADVRRDPWQQLDELTRARLSRWFGPKPGERFLRFFRDTEFSTAEAGVAGIILTDRRILCKVQGEYDDYPLNRHGRVEVMRKGDLVIVHIYQEGNRPAVLKLDPTTVEQLIAALKETNCGWAILT